MLTVTAARRVGAALLAAVTVGVGLAGCGSGGQSHPSSSAASTSATSATVSNEPSGGYDISRISALANQFPPGFTTTPIPRTTLTQQQADSFAGLAKQFPFTFDPPTCAALLKRPHILAGTELQGLVATGPQRITVVAAQSPQPIENNLGSDACNHVTFNAPGSAQGTADRIPGPSIDGVPTVGIKLHLDITLPSLSKSMDQYLYLAVLSNKTGVDLEGESDTQLLESLLVKAVTAIRGH
jgi:hypothetical protein